MLQIPQHIMENLRCSICEGYLSSKPLMVKPENQQVCGKCFRILPTEEKEKCVRQIGLEYISEIIQFPCRYNTQGCGHKLSWCDEKDHEVECPYRSMTNIPHIGWNRGIISTNENENISPIPKSEITCKSEYVEANLRCSLRESEYTNELKTLSYALRVRGHSDRYLSVKRSGNIGEIEDVELYLDGSIHIGCKPEIVYMDIKIKPIIHENIYDSLRVSSKREEYCSNCKVSITEKMQNHCLFGHISCVNCKGNMCVECIQMLEKESKKFCKNFRRGCEAPIEQDDLQNHEMNCRFNEFQCPAEPCNIIDTLPAIKHHLRFHHSQEILQTNEFTEKFYNKDKTIIIVCYENIFKCVYYYYKTFVEFFVTYVGSSDESARYSYEITIESNDNVLSGRSKCCNWNNSMLERGVIFDRKDICDHEKRLSFECKIRILCK
ncbi:hypothetical protein JTB14_033009 [Gonioctena quinquepunctata]|nr:hypothetical protein JTB14_033009 [Gonioctena quinquepunctata]